MKNLKRAPKQVIESLLPGLSFQNESDFFLINKKIRRKKPFLNAIKQGEQVVDFISIQVDYKNSMSILDVGCGDGCVAAAFQRRGHKGRYLGYDIQKQWIDRLTKLYNKKNLNNYKFRYFDIYHSYYNPSGKMSDTEFKFDFEEAFDLVILNSIFSHMTLPVIEHYLKEASRKLAEGGKLWCTMMLVDKYFDNSRLNERTTNTSIDSDLTPYKESFTLTAHNPEEWILHDEHKFLEIVERLNLKVLKYIPGYWKTPRASLDQNHQDVFVLTSSKT